MKNQVTKICAMVLLIATFLSIPAGAQSYNTIKANIPFSFTVGKTAFSSGNYLIQRLFQNGSRGIQINGEDTKQSLVQLTFSDQALAPKDETTLIFHRYGEQYFLSQIWVGGEETGIKLPKSRAEHELAATYSHEQKKYEIVSLVATGK